MARQLKAPATFKEDIAFGKTVCIKPLKQWIHCLTFVSIDLPAVEDVPGKMRNNNKQVKRSMWGLRSYQEMFSHFFLFYRYPKLRSERIGDPITSHRMDQPPVAKRISISCPFPSIEGIYEIYTNTLVPISYWVFVMENRVLVGLRSA